jgi:Cu(I)/Ag(I) efflux system protein CusF
MSSAALFPTASLKEKTMKRLYVTVAALTLAASLAAPALAAEDMSQMSDMKDMPAAAPAKTAHATGVVTGVDGKAGTITIHHGPIPAVGWPAMTMTFKATPTALLKGVKAGDKVAFNVKIQGSSNEITALKKE